MRVLSTIIFLKLPSFTSAMDVFLWLLNGFLAVAYLLWGRILVILLLVPLVWMYVKMPSLCGEFFRPELRPWLAVSSIFWLVSSIFAPSPVPLFLLLMASVSLIVIYLEKFNPAETYWTIISGMTIYALGGIGFAIFIQYTESASASDRIVALYLGQGQNYIGILAGFALYMIPLVYIGMLVRGLLVHAPIRKPQEIARQVRTRGWK